MARKFSLGLALMGHSVTVFTPRYPFLNIKEDKKEEKITVYYLRPFISYGQAACLPQLLWKLKNYDIIHLHVPFLGGAWAVLLFKYFHRSSRFILHYHMDLVGEGIFKIIFWLYTKTILSILIKFSDKVITTSRDYFDNSIIKKILKNDLSKLSIVANGVDHNRFANSKLEDGLKTKLNIKENSKIVLFVGALDKAHYFKGIPLLLGAWKKLKEQPGPSSVLVIVGEGDLKNSYNELARQLKMAGSVIFTGRVKEVDLPLYYRLADITVLPSTDRSEAFGLVLLESMSSGTPVIASNLPGVRSLVEENKTGWLVKPGDSQDLFFKLKEALEGNERLKTMGREAREIAREYDWDKLAVKLNQIILKLNQKSKVKSQNYADEIEHSRQNRNKSKFKN